MIKADVLLGVGMTDQMLIQVGLIAVGVGLVPLLIGLFGKLMGQ